MKPRLRGSVPGELGRIAKRGGTLKDYVETLRLRRFFLFLDYVFDVEPVLEGCDILIRPSRGKNPWGRDIIEAMTYGNPIITLGSYNGFVEHGINGYLHQDFDPEQIAEELLFLAEHNGEVKRMGQANREKAKRLFDGSSNAAKVAAIYESLMKA